MTRSERTVQSTWLAMVALQTIGTVDTQHRLPPPRAFAAISVLWGILFLFADSRYGKLAARLSILITLTAAVVGPAGMKFAIWLGGIARTFGPSKSSTVPTVPTPSAETASVAQTVNP